MKVEVHPINDSEKAVSMINQEKFDGIFLDLEMPNLSGFDLARLIRKSSWNKSTPIIIVTGRDERDTMQQVFSIGATFFLQKPVDRQKLSILFRTVCGGMAENRRRNARVPLQTDVVCQVGHRELHGVTWNLSQSGMQVEVGNLQPKDAVRLSFRLPVSFRLPGPREMDAERNLDSLVFQEGARAPLRGHVHSRVLTDSHRTLNSRSFPGRPAWRTQ